MAGLRNHSSTAGSGIGRARAIPAGTVPVSAGRPHCRPARSPSPAQYLLRRICRVLGTLAPAGRAGLALGQPDLRDSSFAGRRALLQLASQPSAAATTSSWTLLLEGRRLECEHVSGGNHPWPGYWRRAVRRSQGAGNRLRRSHGFRRRGPRGDLAYPLAAANAADAGDELAHRDGGLRLCVAREGRVGIDLARHVCRSPGWSGRFASGVCQ